MNTTSLSRLLNPNTVAIIGASDDPSRIGGKPIAYMLRQGFAGQIMPVNPNRETVQGLKTYPSIDALPQTPDVAIVAVPASAVLETVSALANRGCAGAIIFSAGFAEVGDKGAALQDEMVSTAKAHGMRLIGPNSLGIVNPQTNFYGSFATGLELGFPKPGNVAIVSQSGAYGAHLMTAAVAAGIGLSTMVMTGNEADLTLGDIINLLVDDPNTKVIALYSEGVREAGALVSALDRARQMRKPVVIMKVGQSALGQAAALSHTASIAGDDRVFDAVMAELGVVRAQTTEQMLDIARLAIRGIYPADNTLGVFTISGGAGVIISDAAAAHGLAMPPMPEHAQKRLLELLPFASPVNPVDTTAQVLNDMTLMRAFTESLVTDGGYTSILGFVTYTATAPTTEDRLHRELVSLKQAYPDRLFVLVALGEKDKLRRYEDDGFTVFEDPSRAVAAIAAMGRYGKAFNRQSTPTSVPTNSIHLPDETPSEASAKGILAAAGISIVPETVCKTAEQAIAAAQSLNGPVVLKIVSPDILHKTEMGGVLLNIEGDDQVRAGFDTLIERAKQHDPAARIEGVLVAKQMQGGVQCLLGIQRDPVFGPMAVFGLGGIFVEILDDVVLHRCPFDEDVAFQMIHSIKGASLLLGARGQAKSDIKALATMLAKLSGFAMAAGPRLQSIDLNPVFVMPEGEGAYAADALITLQ
ncbi:MAG: acetate--CoA ligase family protein [Burkholderiaceae bacterium]|nr:acetate--CoA ligase family protein [Burkholderiaceae bacterium]MCD8517258.1 acetate--CoA ligase family protein [Burkholderiaceae bacterium]MCD8537792.1 acetate--CoA ligase family protein [Burkholderiaceae bacterium]MCD8564888.1 acetate--CoA ligase family protein [Burkholderiaceae bacterium]